VCTTATFFYVASSNLPLVARTQLRMHCCGGVVGVVRLRSLTCTCKHWVKSYASAQ